MANSPGLLATLGVQFDKSVEPPVIALTVDERHRQVNGVVHGSVLHALLDTAMGMSCFRANGRQPVATAEISVRYLEPVFDGRLEATAHIVKLGKRVITVTAQVVRDDVTVAIATASFVPIAAR